MKREILFRGVNFQKEWVYGDLFHSYANDDIAIAYYREGSKTPTFDAVFPESVGQYTRLKDKNRKKIFEWDILFQGQEFLGVVCVSKRYGVSILKKTTTWSLINFVLDSDFDAGVLSDIEVRGNIYDNPELIKQRVWVQKS